MLATSLFLPGKSFAPTSTWLNVVGAAPTTTTSCGFNHTGAGASPAAPASLVLPASPLAPASPVAPASPGAPASLLSLVLLASLHAAIARPVPRIIPNIVKCCLFIVCSALSATPGAENETARDAPARRASPRLRAPRNRKSTGHRKWGHGRERGRSPGCRIFRRSTLPRLFAQWICRTLSPVTVAGAAPALHRLP